MVPKPLLAALGAGEVFRRAFEDATDGILVTDDASRIVLANPAWLALHGYVADEVIGRTPTIVKSAHTSAEVHAEMWRHLRDPTVAAWRGELVNRRKDGTELPVLLTIGPIRHEGAIAGWMAITVDLGERKRLEEWKRLHDLVVWHDLRSPLGVIANVVDLLLDGAGGALSAAQRDLLVRARRQAGRMRELIATSLDLEKLKARKLSLDLEPVDLVAAVRASFETHGADSATRRVGLVLQVGDRPARDDDRVFRDLDPLHLSRCTDNLVKNAIEASPAGGEVRAVVRETPEGVLVRVENGGPPIPPDVRATLFHPFGTYGKRGGTGLGLHGVKLLVEAMGGTVRHEPLASGTAFELAFPRAG